MLRVFHLPLSFPPRVGVWILAVGMVGNASYAARKDKVKKDESLPELISRTGGAGETWSDAAELKAAADKGNVKAKTQLGELKLLGEHVDKDIPGGLVLLEAAARAGEAPAAFRLGKVYDDGVLVPRDRPRAFDYYRAAAAGGSPEAFFNLGATYASGRGVKRDYTEALAWLILAKKRGVENDGERKLRAQIISMKRPEWIPAAEKRAELIARELEERKMAGLLPTLKGSNANLPASPKPSPTVIPPPAISPPTPGKAPVTREQPGVISPVLPPPLFPKP